MAKAEPRGDTVRYPCAHCGAVNRIPRERVGQNPTCGKCKEKIFPRAPVKVTGATFAREVEGSPIPVLVDFWAPWCGPCRVVAPALEAIAGERAGRVKIAKVNVDENQALAARFGIRSIPTLAVFRGGRAVDQLVGAMAKAQIEARLDRLG